MAEPFLGEIRMFGNNYAPQGWALCNGQLLQIQQNQALFALLGTTYGGDGKTTFGLPDLQGRVPIHFNANFPLGDKKGEATHTLTVNEMPIHTHQVSGSTNTDDSTTPTGNTWGVQTQKTVFSPAASTVNMNAAAMTPAGSSQAHPNMQPFLAVNYCIALTGIFPSRS